MGKTQVIRRKSPLLQPLKDLNNFQNVAAKSKQKLHQNNEILKVKEDPLCFSLTNYFQRKNDSKNILEKRNRYENIENVENRNIIDQNTFDCSSPFFQ